MSLSWASADVTIADKWASTSFLYLTLMCFRANVAVEKGLAYIYIQIKTTGPFTSSFFSANVS